MKEDKIYYCKTINSGMAYIFVKDESKHILGCKIALCLDTDYLYDEEEVAKSSRRISNDNDIRDVRLATRKERKLLILKTIK